MPTYFSTRLTDRPQFPSEEKSPRRQKEEQYSDCIVGCDHPESGRITEKLGYDTTQQYPYAKAEIPGSKDGGIGSASLVMTGEWKKPGVWNMEQMDPDPFMDLMNKHGLPWQERFLE